MIAEILVTGQEILSGSVIDTNSAQIAQKLEEAGLEVTRHLCVGDDMEDLVSIIKEISKRSDVAVVTGGLGPTTDDITAEAAAKSAGVELVLNRPALKTIEDYFKERKRTMTSSNKKQAMLPKDSECLFNPVGTAPGFSMKIGRCLFFFLPGVPFEMFRMLSDRVLPMIEKHQGRAREVKLIKTFSTFGLTESAIGEQLAGLTAEFPEIKLGIRAKFPEIHVTLYCRGKDSKGHDQSMEKASKWVMKKIGTKVFSDDGDSMEAIVGGLLAGQKATLAVAESCTGGLISHWLTNVPGSSEYFLYSVVTYSNESKSEQLGVSTKILERYGAVHEETAKEMAEGVRRVAGSTYGLSTSGIAGPTGGTKDKPVGTVFIGLASPHSVKGFRFFFPFNSRWRNKKIFAMTALDLLRHELQD